HRGAHAVAVGMHQVMHGVEHVSRVFGSHRSVGFIVDKINETVDISLTKSTFYAKGLHDHHFFRDASP
ncbi:hypothetical protein, partial [Acidovorax cavernicola]|uniref:hypothetical protein n=1 Tax=Acidovorax cavernicola TaxID=1675792 RepID=UPI00197B067F